MGYKAQPPPCSTGAALGPAEAEAQSLGEVREGQALSWLGPIPF